MCVWSYLGRMPSWDVVCKTGAHIGRGKRVGWPDISNLALKSNQGQSLNLYRSAFGGQIYFDTNRVEQRVFQKKILVAKYPNSQISDIWLFGYLARCANWGIPERCIKNAAQKHWLRSVGHSILKLWPKMDFETFPPLYILWISKKCPQTVIFQDKNLKI